MLLYSIMYPVHWQLIVRLSVFYLSFHFIYVLSLLSFHYVMLVSHSFSSHSFLVWFNFWLYSNSFLLAIIYFLSLLSQFSFCTCFIPYSLPSFLLVYDFLSRPFSFVPVKLIGTNYKNANFTAKDQSFATLNYISLLVYPAFTVLSKRPINGGKPSALDLFRRSLLGRTAWHFTYRTSSNKYERSDINSLHTKVCHYQDKGKRSRKFCVNEYFMEQPVGSGLHSRDNSLLAAVPATWDAKLTYHSPRRVLN
jgi:hypothetical protein